MAKSVNGASGCSYSIKPSEDENGIFRGEVVIIKRYQKSGHAVHLARQQLVE